MLATGPIAAIHQKLILPSQGPPGSGAGSEVLNQRPTRVRQDPSTERRCTRPGGEGVLCLTHQRLTKVLQMLKGLE
jgi:hypothetical protein